MLRRQSPVYDSIELAKDPQSEHMGFDVKESGNFKELSKRMLDN